MKRRTKIFAGGIFLLLAGATGGMGYMAYSFSLVEPYRNVRAVRNLNDIQSRLPSGEGPWTVQTIGEIHYPSFDAPVWAVSRSPVSPAKRRCLIVGGVHGNEPAGTEAALQFIAQLVASPSLYPETAFDIIPLANPWGWVHNRRRNYERYDLNRDFARFHTQETRLLRDFLRGKRYDLALDLHEDSSANGFYVYQYAEDTPRPARDLITQERAAGHSIAQEARMVILTARDGVIRAPMWTLYFVRAIRTMSIGNVLRLDYSDRAYTLETPSSFPMETRVDMDLLALHYFLSPPP